MNEESQVRGCYNIRFIMYNNYTLCFKKNQIQFTKCSPHTVIDVVFVFCFFYILLMMFTFQFRSYVCFCVLRGK